MFDVDIEQNNSVNASQVNPIQGMFFSTQNTSSLSLRMFNNSSTTINNSQNGYLLNNTAGTFVVQSPNALLTGVAALNSGSSATPNSATKFDAVETTGTIQYLPPFILNQAP
jgi:hypothetical protein